MIQNLKEGLLTLIKAQRIGKFGLIYMHSFMEFIVEDMHPYVDVCTVGPVLG